MSKHLANAAILVLAAFTATVVVAAWRRATMRSVSEAGLVKVVSTLAGDARLKGHLLGPRNAAVVITEWADFQCPYCAKEKWVLDSMRALHPKDVAVAFRHFPLRSVHPYAESAALASECADGQNQFSQFYDAAYQYRDSIGVRPWDWFAALAGVKDLAAFDRCLSEEDGKERIAEDVAAGKHLGVIGTPTLLIGQRMLQGAVSAAVLDSVVAAQLRAAVQR